MVSDEDMLKEYKLAVETSSKLVVCPMCGGRGYWVEEVLVSYHRGEYEDHCHKCNTCQSTGFVWKIKKKVVAAPKSHYKTSPKIFYESYNPVEETKRKTEKE